MWLDYFIYTSEALALPAFPGSLVGRTQIDTDADFQALLLTATAIDRRVRFLQVETSTGRQLSDFPASLGTGCGDGRHPFRLPVSKKLKVGTGLATQFWEESGAPNQVRMALHGAKVLTGPPFDPGPIAAREYFSYTAPFVAVAVDPAGIGAIIAGGIGIYNIRIQPDAHFEADKICIEYDLAIPAGLDSVATIELRDESLGRRFMDRPIPVENLGAARNIDPLGQSAMYPFVFPAPRLLQAGSLLGITVQNLDVANALTMRVTIHGQKLYRSAPGA